MTDDEIPPLPRVVASAIVTRGLLRWSCSRMSDGDADIKFFARREGTKLEFWDMEAVIGARWQDGKLVDAVPELAIVENEPIGPEEWFRPLSVVPEDVREELEQGLAGRRAQRRSWTEKGVIL